MDIGNRIKARREYLNMSQEELAFKVGYKSRSSINKIEADGRGLPQRKIVAFAKALETTPAYLMGWDDDIDMSNEDKPFYFDDETAEIAHDMYFHARSILKVYQSEDKDKLIEYANTLLLAQQYKDYERKAARIIPISSSENDYLYADAANQNPDATLEQTAFDDDVMDDPDF